ncbi:MAG: OmpH family outer membrane protein [Armatimonadota bacterium]
MAIRDWAGGVVAGLLAVGIAGAVVAPGMAVAQGKGQKGATAVGFVDLNQITDQIKTTAEWQVSVKKFEDTKAKLRSEIEGLTKLRYLTKAEREELDTLRAKPKPTEQEKSRIGALETKSNTLDQEYNGLVQTEKHTAEQKSRFDELHKLREDSLASLQVETEKRATVLQQMEVEVLDGMQKKVLDYVKDVAEKKDIEVVMDRQAVLHGGADLTNEVLKKMGAPVK